MKTCIVRFNDDFNSLYIKGYITHHIGKNWSVFKGSFHTYIVRTEQIKYINIREEGVLDEKA